MGDRRTSTPQDPAPAPKCGGEIAGLIQIARKDLAKTLERLSILQWSMAEGALGPALREGLRPSDIAMRARRQRTVLGLMQEIVEIDCLASDLLRASLDESERVDGAVAGNVVDIRAPNRRAGRSRAVRADLPAMADAFVMRVRQVGADLKDFSDLLAQARADGS